jgi:hypothetical protein
MDISTIQQQAAQEDEAVVVTIVQPDGEPYQKADGEGPVTISVLGGYSKRIRAVREQQMRRMLKDRRAKLEPEDMRRNRIEAAVAAITGWDGWTANGQPFPFTPENAEALFTQAPWILDQVESAIDGHARFFKSSSGS